MPSMPGSGTLVPPELDDDVDELVELDEDELDQPGPDQPPDLGWPPEPDHPPASAGVAASNPVSTTATVALRFIGVPLSWPGPPAGLDG